MTSDPAEGVQAPGPEDTEAARPQRVVARPSADSRLEALHALYNACKQEAANAKNKFDELKKAITAELEAEYRGGSRPTDAYEIPASAYGPALTVYYKTQDYLPAADIRENFPDIYEAFKREKRFSEVRESQQGGSGGRRK